MKLKGVTMKKEKTLTEICQDIADLFIYPKFRSNHFKDYAKDWENRAYEYKKGKKCPSTSTVKNI
jgi:hypothetical protein